ncbi:MAG: hypothetical protein ACYDD4_02910 [Acidimicrobiales bacterium]
MTSSGDLHGEMHRYPIDEGTAERLLTGHLDPEDAPPGFGHVASLVRVATGPANALELAGRQQTVAAMAAAIATSAGQVPASIPRGKRMIGKLLTLKTLGIAIPAMALTAGSAAAATGSLPAPAQAAAHSVLSDVGISVPSGNDSSSSKAVGPDATGSAMYGLCTAYKANGGHANSHSVAFANLAKAAGGAANISTFCANVTPPGKGSNSSNDSNGAASDGTSTPAGPPTSTPGSSHANGQTPAGPPTSTPGSSHANGLTPAGPPTSTPASSHANGHSTSGASNSTGRP